jgi:hypothetical protein
MIEVLKWPIKILYCIIFKPRCQQIYAIFLSSNSYQAAIVNCYWVYF